MLSGCGGGTNGTASGGGGSTGGGGPTGSGGNGSNSSTTVTFTFTGTMPSAVATQVGSGSFTLATVSSGAVSLSVPSGTTRFALAYVCPPGNETAGLTAVTSTTQSVIEATVADGTSYTAPCPFTATGQTGSLGIDVDASAIAGTSNLNIVAQNGNSIAADYVGAARANFTISAPAGSDWVDLLAYQTNSSGLDSLVAIKSFSAQTVPGSLNGGNAVVLGAADATIPEPITYNNVPQGFNSPYAQVTFQPATRNFDTLLALNATSMYPALPTGVAQGGDLYVIQGQANLNPSSGGSVSDESVMALSTLSNPGPVSLTFPAPWIYAGPTPAALPTLNFSYTGFAGHAGLRQGAAMYWMLGNSVANAFEIDASANYQAGSTSISFPTLAGLTGFLAPAPSGTLVTWEAYETLTSVGFASSFGKLPANTTESQVLDFATYVVP